MKFFATIKKGTGVAIIHNRGEMNRFISSLSRDDRDIRVEFDVKKARSHRSLLQNAYYHGVVVNMVRERLSDLGHEVDHNATHEFLKGRFLYSELVDEKSGEIIKVPKSSTELTKSEFMDYLEEIKRFAAQSLDIFIPDPNTQLEIEQ